MPAADAVVVMKPAKSRWGSFAGKDSKGEESSDGGVGANGMRKSMEANVNIANLRAKVLALGRKVPARKNFDAIADLVDEARINKALLLGEEQAADALQRVLAAPPAARRAVSLRELTELGRSLVLAGQDVGDRKHTYLWYHSLARMRLVTLEPGTRLTHAGEAGDCCYWLLGGSLHATDDASTALDQTHAFEPVSFSQGACQQAPAQHAALHRTMQPAAVLADDIAGKGIPTAQGNQHLQMGLCSATQQQQPSCSGSCMVAAPAHMPAARAASDHAGLPRWSRVGEEALSGAPYTSSVWSGPCGAVCASLHRSDYAAVCSALARESFEGLRAQHLLLCPRGSRTAEASQELAGMMAVTELFKNMSEEFNAQVCSLLEYMSVPEGFVLFEEGDRTDFCYIVLSGEVTFSRYSEARHAREDLVIKGAGEHFGTLATLAESSKRRPFSARASQPTQFALISRFAYNRVVKAQLQAAIAARTELLKGLAAFKDATAASLHRAATACQDESFPAGARILEAGTSANKLYIIVEGCCKLQWGSVEPHAQPPGIDTHLLVVSSASSLQAKAAASAAGAVSVSAQGLGTATGFGADSEAVAQMGLQVLARGSPFGTGSSSPAAAAAAAAAVAGGGMAKAWRRMHVLDVALLGSGDVLNGPVLLGRTSAYDVIAQTQVKVLAFEASSAETVLGSHATAHIKEVVLQQQAAYRERVACAVAARLSTAHSMASDAARAARGNDALQFLEHYVLGGGTAKAGERTAGEAAGSVAHATADHLNVVDRMLQQGLHQQPSGQNSSNTTTITPHPTTSTVLCQQVCVSLPPFTPALCAPSPSMVALLGYHATGQRAPAVLAGGSGSCRAGSRDPITSSSSSSPGKQKARVTKDGKIIRRKELVGLTFAGTVAMYVLDSDVALMRHAGSAITGPGTAVKQAATQLGAGSAADALYRETGQGMMPAASSPGLGMTPSQLAEPQSEASFPVRPTPPFQPLSLRSSEAGDMHAGRQQQPEQEQQLPEQQGADVVEPEPSADAEDRGDGRSAVGTLSVPGILPQVQQHSSTTTDLILQQCIAAKYTISAAPSPLQHAFSPVAARAVASEAGPAAERLQQSAHSVSDSGGLQLCPVPDASTWLSPAESRANNGNAAPLATGRGVATKAERQELNHVGHGDLEQACVQHHDQRLSTAEDCEVQGILLRTTIGSAPNAAAAGANSGLHARVRVRERSRTETEVLAPRHARHAAASALGAASDAALVLPGTRSAASVLASRNAALFLPSAHALGIRDALSMPGMQGTSQGSGSGSKQRHSNTGGTLLAGGKVISSSTGMMLGCDSMLVLPEPSAMSVAVASGVMQQTRTSSTTCASPSSALASASASGGGHALQPLTAAAATATALADVAGLGEGMDAPLLPMALPGGHNMRHITHRHAHPFGNEAGPVVGAGPDPARQLAAAVSPLSVAPALAHKLLVKQAHSQEAARFAADRLSTLICGGAVMGLADSMHTGASRNGQAAAAAADRAGAADGLGRMAPEGRSLHGMRAEGDGVVVIVPQHLNPYASVLAGPPVKPPGFSKARVPGPHAHYDHQQMYVSAAAGAAGAASTVPLGGEPPSQKLKPLVVEAVGSSPTVSKSSSSLSYYAGGGSGSGGGGLLAGSCSPGPWGQHPPRPVSLPALHHSTTATSSTGMGSVAGMQQQQQQPALQPPRPSNAFLGAGNAAVGDGAGTGADGVDNTLFPVPSAPVDTAHAYARVRAAVTAMRMSARMVGACGHRSEPMLPLEADGQAPPLADHQLSAPTLLDIQYILHRWGARWAHDRQVATETGYTTIGACSAPTEGAALGASSLPSSHQQQHTLSATARHGPFDRPLERLEMFGAPFKGGTPRRRGS